MPDDIDIEELKRLEALASPAMLKRIARMYVMCEEHGNNAPECGKFAAVQLAAQAPALARRVVADAETLRELRTALAEGCQGHSLAESPKCLYCQALAKLGAPK